jgi:hypothetical protein
LAAAIIASTYAYGVVASIVPAAISEVVIETVSFGIRAIERFFGCPELSVNPVS